MATRIIRFPIEQTSRYKQTQIEAILARDPNYCFIRDLLQALTSIGMDLDKTPEAKARELYTKYQRENLSATGTAETD